MKDRVFVRDAMPHQMERSRNFLDLIDPKGRFALQHVRAGKVIGEIPFNNGVTDAGKLQMLNAMFNGAAQSTNWFLGLIDGSSSTPTLTNLDTAASHTGWSEFVTYNETTRQAWTKGGAAANTVTGTTASVFTIGNVPANAYVAGGFVIDNNTKGGTTGLLWSTGVYQNPVSVQATDIFKLAYITGL